MEETIHFEVADEQTHDISWEETDPLQVRGCPHDTDPAIHFTTQ